MPSLLSCSLNSAIAAWLPARVTPDGLLIAATHTSPRPLIHVERFGLAQARGEHAARPGRGGLQPGTVVADRDGVVEAQHAGDVGGADLADAVPDDSGRVHTVARQFRGQPDLHQEVRGLSDLGAGHP